MSRLMAAGAALLVLGAWRIAAAGVDGDWTLVLTAPEGATEFTMSIAVDGSDVFGRVGDAEFTGTLDGERMRLAGDLFVPEAGYVAPLDLDLRLDGEELRGIATWDVYTANVVGKRPR